MLFAAQGRVTLPDTESVITQRSMNARRLRAGLLASLLLVGCGADTESRPPSWPPPPPPPGAPPPSSQVQPVSPPPSAPPGPATPSTPPPPPSSAGQPQAGPPPGPPPPAPQPQQAAPPASQWVYSYPQGQWVYASDRGWIWVPAGAATANVDGVPYAYLYMPLYGWTWYLSPWGWGPYHYGGWVLHPWLPLGWRGAWAMHPRAGFGMGVRGGFRGGFRR
jgi:hypothetical protein